MLHFDAIQIEKKSALLTEGIKRNKNNFNKNAYLIVFPIKFKCKSIFKKKKEIHVLVKSIYSDKKFV